MTIVLGASLLPDVLKLMYILYSAESSKWIQRFRLTEVASKFVIRLSLKITSLARDFFTILYRVTQNVNDRYILTSVIEVKQICDESESTMKDT